MAESVDVSSVRLTLLKTRFLVGRLVELAELAKAGDTKAGETHKALIADCTADDGGLDYRGTINDFSLSLVKASAVSHALVSRVESLRAAFVSTLTSESPASEFFTAADELATALQESVTPDTARIGQAAETIRGTVPGFREASAEIGEDPEHESRCKRVKLLNSHFRCWGRAIQTAIGAGAFQHDAGYLQAISGVYDHVQGEHIELFYYQGTVDVWQALRDRGYGKGYRYPNCELDSHLEEHAARAKRYAENALAISDLIAEHAEGLSVEADKATPQAAEKQREGPAQNASRKQRITPDLSHPLAQFYCLLNWERDFVEQAMQRDRLALQVLSDDVHSLSWALAFAARRCSGIRRTWALPWGPQDVERYRHLFLHEGQYDPGARTARLLEWLDYPIDGLPARLRAYRAATEECVDRGRGSVVADKLTRAYETHKVAIDAVRQAADGNGEGEAEPLFEAMQAAGRLFEHLPSARGGGATDADPPAEEKRNGRKADPLDALCSELWLAYTNDCKLRCSKPSRKDVLNWAGKRESFRNFVSENRLTSAKVYAAHRRHDAAERKRRRNNRHSSANN